MADVSSPGTDAIGDFVDRLMDEYKILQDKIDKIGAFRFTIKGWSITIIIASVFAGSTTKTAPRWLWAISLFVFLIVFFFYEKQQTDLRRRFGRRVLAIEFVVSRLLKNLTNASSNPSIESSFLTLHFVPGIGHDAGTRTERRQPTTGPRTYWRSCVDADIAFYLALLVVVLAFVFWPGRSVSPDQGNNIFINNASGTALQKVDTQRDQTNSGQGNSPLAASKNDKSTKSKKEHESH
jgi:hypothetical protein